MDRLRLASPQSIPPFLPCCRCGQSEGCWDRIAGKAYCPDCQEMLAVGEGDPLIEPTEKHHCAVCNRVGTICFHTFPLQSRTPVAMDLCPEHLRGLLARCLSPFAYFQLQRQLQRVGVRVQDLFLLHDAFYTSQGHALQPAIELDR
jgi:hypothetical protein